MHEHVNDGVGTGEDDEKSAFYRMFSVILLKFHAQLTNSEDAGILRVLVMILLTQLWLDSRNCRETTSDSRSKQYKKEPFPTLSIFCIQKCQSHRIPSTLQYTHSDGTLLRTIEEMKRRRSYVDRYALSVRRIIECFMESCTMPNQIGYWCQGYLSRVDSVVLLRIDGTVTGEPDRWPAQYKAELETVRGVPRGIHRQGSVHTNLATSPKRDRVMMWEGHRVTHRRYWGIDQRLTRRLHCMQRRLESLL